MSAYMTIDDLIELAENNHNKIFYVNVNGQNFKLGNLISYRGDYREPAIKLELNDVHVTGREIAQHLEYAVSVTHTGYKGGQFDFSEDQELWVTTCRYSTSSLKIDNANFKEIADVEESIVLMAELAKD